MTPLERLKAAGYEQRARGGAKRGERRARTTILSLHQHDFRRFGDEWRCSQCGSKSEKVGEIIAIHGKMKVLD